MFPLAVALKQTHYAAPTELWKRLSSSLSINIPSLRDWLFMGRNFAKIRLGPIA